MVGKEAVSPDRGKSVSLRLVVLGESEEFPAVVELKTGRTSLTAKIVFGLNAEVLWSPDSKAFAVTGSREGANGLYFSDVFLLESDRLVRVPLTQTIRRAFGHPVKCGWPEFPNVAAVAWTVPSSRIVVVAEVINHSNCDSFGTFKAYEVDIPTRRIVKTHNQISAKKQFKADLGIELLNAPDNCILSPRACYVATNHPEEQAP